MKFFLLVSQLAPAYPGWQLQTYPLTWSVHDPPFKQGLLEHSLMSMSTYCLSNCHDNAQDNQRITPVIQMCTHLGEYFFPLNHAHIYSVCRCKCLPVWHLAPAYPGWQLQTYALTWSVHVPPLKQGLLEHSLMSTLKSKIIVNNYPNN